MVKEVLFFLAYYHCQLGIIVNGARIEGQVEEDIATSSLTDNYLVLYCFGSLGVELQYISQVHV